MTDEYLLETLRKFEKEIKKEKNHKSLRIGICIYYVFYTLIVVGIAIVNSIDFANDNGEGSSDARTISDFPSFFVSVLGGVILFALILFYIIRLKQ